MTRPDVKIAHGLPDLFGRAPRITDRDAGRDNNFNLIRLIAACGVLVSHAYPLSLGRSAAEPLQGLLRGVTLGTVCVYAFFAISGFFITRSLVQRGAVGPFLKARALRLFPALAVVLALTVLVMGPLVTTAPAGVYWTGVPGYYLHNVTLFFLHYDLPGVFTDNPNGTPINGSLWSLSYEVTCYLGVLAFGLLGLLRRPRAFLPVVLVFVVFYAVAMTHAAAMSHGLAYRLNLLAELGLPFGIGMAFWIWRDRIPLSLPLTGALAGLAALAWFTPLFMPFLVLAIAYAVFVLGYARIPAIAAYARRGDYSYGMYVYAYPVQQLIAHAGVRDPLINICLALPATLACATLSWHLVEAPALRLRRKRLAAGGEQMAGRP